MTAREDKNSYGQILKSTGIIGGSQVITILVGIVRTKIVAILIGPAGFGIMSALQATIDMMRQATGFGINYSAVREISQHSEPAHIDRVLLILRRWALYTGLLGVVVTVLLCYPLSWYAFDSSEYALSIACVSVILLITSISSAQTAVLQGLRLLRKMAKAAIGGAILGTVFVIPLYYFLGVKGIVPALILTALSSWLISWLYTRRISPKKTELSFKETIRGGMNMATLGLYLVLTSFIVTLIMYTIRAFIVREMDLDAVGWFQSAWSVSNIYIGIVLSAMGADFFPRLSAVHTDNKQANILINQQLEMVMLIITPLLMLMIGGADLLVRILYSNKFVEAVAVLQWQLGGGILTVVSWCLGVMYLAKNKGYYSLITETIWGVIYLAFVVGTWSYLGFLSLGIGYVLANVVKTIIVFCTLRRLSRLTLSRPALQDMALFFGATAAMLINVSLISGIVQYTVSSIIFVFVTVYCYKRISSVIDLRTIFRKLLKRHSDAKSDPNDSHTDL